MLGSVHEMNLGGNIVVLDGSKSYTQSKETGRNTRIACGQRVARLWVPSDRRINDEEQNKMSKGNMFAMLATVKEENQTDFTRRVRMP